MTAAAAAVGFSMMNFMATAAAAGGRRPAAPAAFQSTAAAAAAPAPAATALSDASGQPGKNAQLEAMILQLSAENKSIKEKLAASILQAPAPPAPPPPRPRQPPPAPAPPRGAGAKPAAGAGPLEKKKAGAAGAAAAGSAQARALWKRAADAHAPRSAKAAKTAAAALTVEGAASARRSRPRNPPARLEQDAPPLAVERSAPGLKRSASARGADEVARRSEAAAAKTGPWSSAPARFGSRGASGGGRSAPDRGDDEEAAAATLGGLSKRAASARGRGESRRRVPRPSCRMPRRRAWPEPHHSRDNDDEDEEEEEPAPPKRPRAAKAAAAEAAASDDDIKITCGGFGYREGKCGLELGSEEWPERDKSKFCRPCSALMRAAKKADGMPSPPHRRAAPASILSQTAQAEDAAGAADVEAVAAGAEGAADVADEGAAHQLVVRWRVVAVGGAAEGVGADAAECPQRSRRMVWRRRGRRRTRRRRTRRRRRRSTRRMRTRRTRRWIWRRWRRLRLRTTPPSRVHPPPTLLRRQAKNHELSPHADTPENLIVMCTANTDGCFGCVLGPEHSLPLDG